MAMDADYQHKRHNQYWLEPPRYHMALSYVRQYPRLCRLRDDILHGSYAASDVAAAPKGVKSDPTAQRGVSLAQVDEILTVIDKALSRIPQEYRQPVLDNILYRNARWHVAGKYNLSESTVQRWRARLLWEVARLAHIP